MSFKHTTLTSRAAWRNRRRVAPDESLELEPWLGTELDPLWMKLKNEIESFTPALEATRAHNDCQAALGRLAALAEMGGPVGDRASQALFSLIHDVHHEIRTSRPQTSSSPREYHLGPGSVLRRCLTWFGDAVGAGEPNPGLNAQSVKRAFTVLAALRLLISLGAGMLLAIGRPGIAALVYIVPGPFITLGRFWTNAEAGVPFSSRFFACLLSHAGDAAVYAGAAWFVTNTFGASPGALVLASLFTLLGGTIIREGALHVGVYVPRKRSEQFYRAIAISFGVVLLAFGHPWAFGVSLTMSFLWTILESVEVFRNVHSAQGEEFSWTLKTSSGYRSDILTVVSPPEEDLTAIGVGSPAILPRAQRRTASVSSTGHDGLIG
jgi:hypothetical protein